MSAILCDKRNKLLFARQIASTVSQRPSPPSPLHEGSHSDSFGEEQGGRIDSRPSTWQKGTVMSLEEVYNWQAQIREMIQELGQGNCV